MPNLQLDVTNAYPVSVKRNLARRFGEIYAEIMQTTPDLVDVTFRELGEGGLWRCGNSEPVPAVTLICDIRRGPSAGATRATCEGTGQRQHRCARA